MLDAFRTQLDQYISMPEYEGPDKVCSLSQAIQNLIKPGMCIHTVSSHNRPGAAVIELVRQFKGQNPNFSLSSLGVVSTSVLLVHTGLVNKLITTFAGDSYPTPGPNPVISKAYLKGHIAIENWTILTFPMRLLAGAMNLPFIPTQSLIGSSMAEENAEWFTEAEDENGATIGLLRAFRPDIAFVHAAAADRAGNVLMTPPYGEDAWGALAAKEGVIATVERLVSSDFVRRYAHLCKIPSYMVKAVCEVPFGAHPGGMSNIGLPEIDSYADDYDFVQDFRAACKKEADLDSWIKYWIEDAGNWQAYLERLSQNRIWFLKGKAHKDSWKSELLTLSPDIQDGPAYSPVEMMAIVGARLLAQRIQEEKYKTILAGVGTSNLSAWLAYYFLRDAGCDCELMAEIGFYGYTPRPADPFIFNFRNMPACKMLTGIPAIMGVFMSGAANRNIGSIGAAQVDKHGNVNSTKIPGKAYLVGSGGANDICSAAQETMVSALQDKFRFVDKVDYISSVGQRVRSLVSDLGVFEKLHPQGELVLTAFFPQPGQDHQQTIQNIKDNCGWELKVSGIAKPVDPPSLDELKLLRIFDPKRQFLGKK